MSQVQTSEKPEIFLSYSSHDIAWAENLRTSLEHREINVWQDQERIEPGAHFSIRIEQAIRRAAAMVLLVTRASAGSDWVRNEVIFAQRARKRIIPLLLEPDTPEMIEIVSVQHIQMYSDWDTGLARLVECINQLTADQVPCPQEEQTTPTLPAADEGDPFVWGGAVPPDLFTGRRAALDVIKSHVGQSRVLQSLSIVANRRMGKSSLLNYVCQRCQDVFGTEPRYVAIYVDAMDARAHTISGFMRILRRKLRQPLGREPWREEDDGNLAILNEAFEDIAELDGIRVVLLLDELESVMAHTELDPLLEALRFNGSRGQIGMITATAHTLADLTKLGLLSPFYNIFRVHYLGNMPRSEWQVIVESGLQKSGRRPTERDYRLVGELAGGHPYLTQLAGSLLWRADREGWTDRQIHDRFHQDARMIFSSTLQRLDADQVRAIKCAVGLAPGLSAPESTMEELRQRGLLTASGEVFCTPFAEFLVSEWRQ
jgi:hypothetical protein